MTTLQISNLRQRLNQRLCVLADNRASGSSSEGYGGGLYALGAGLTLNGCVFQGNTAIGNGGGAYLDNGCLLDAVDVMFISNDAGNAGGGLHIGHQATGTVTSSTFAMKSSRYGGAAYLDQDSNFDSTFESCMFDSNSAESGGALRSANGAMTHIVDCDFQTNHATIRAGGIDAVDDAAVAIIGSTFASNESATEGGAIMTTGRSLEIQDSSFIGNRANFAGGLGASQLDFVVLQNVVFDGNVARGSSGACEIWQAGTVDIADCTVINNLAMGQEGGGYGVAAGVRLNHILASATVSSCDIRNNIAFGDGVHETEGGGILIDGPGVSAQVSGSVVCGNSPDQVAGPYTDLGGNCISEVCDSDADGTLDCNDGCPDDPDKIDPGQCGCGIEDVDSDGDGIADCVDPCPNWPYDCSSDGQTIFVAVGQSIQSAIDVTPAGGIVQLGAGSFAQSSIDPTGKAITIQGTVDVDGSLLTTIDAGSAGSVLVFQSGEGRDTKVLDLILTGGQSEFGGGVECSNASSPTIAGCRIEGNAAGAYGGGINCYAGSNPLIESCSILGNSAAAGGGGGAIDTSAPMIVRCVIEGNSAPAGAGIYAVESSDTELGESTVCGNDAEQIFGVINDLGDNCILDDCGDDLDGNGLPDACDPDCDGDGLPDGYEIETGTQLDCDGDGLPDDCAIVDGVVIDCNGNGVPDSCDIESGTEEDDNLNDVPDSCDIAAGDLNVDGCIDSGDLGLLIALWGLSNPPLGDLNGDGIIGPADLGLLIGNWTPCEP